MFEAYVLPYVVGKALRLHVYLSGTEMTAEMVRETYTLLNKIGVVDTKESFVGIIE